MEVICQSSSTVVFRISADDFSKLFNVVELCNVNPDSLDEVAESSSPSTQAAWSITEHEGAWVPGSSAGGSRRYNSGAKSSNPDVCDVTLHLHHFQTSSCPSL